MTGALNCRTTYMEMTVPEDSVDVVWSIWTPSVPVALCNITGADITILYCIARLSRFCQYKWGLGARTEKNAQPASRPSMRYLVQALQIERLY